MIIQALDVADLPAIEHDEAMAVAAAEYGRLIDLVDGFTPDDWRKTTGGSRPSAPVGTSGTWCPTSSAS
jgi:hypothetical protein